MGGHGHAGGRPESQDGEQKVASKVGIGAALSQAQRLQVIGESEGDDGEVGRDGEHGEQG